MSVLQKFSNLTGRLLIRNTPLFRRNYIPDKDFEAYLEIIKPAGLKSKMPGPYPYTEEQRRAAAEKYGMHPDEYKPLPPGAGSAGDYPDLPWIGAEARDPYYPWDYPGHRTNFEEPLHYQFDIMGEHSYAFGVPQRMNDYHCAMLFVVIFVSWYILFSMSAYTTTLMSEKQIPGEGVHYSFET